MYQLILFDNKNNKMVIYETKDIFNIDCITSEFYDKNEFLIKMEEKFNKEFYDVIIRSCFNKRERYIKDIMFSNNVMLEHESLCVKYAGYLYEDKERIYDSFIYNIPRFKNGSVYEASYFELVEYLSRNMDSYRKQRDCYFQLVNSGKLAVSRRKRDDVSDPLRCIIDNINTDDGRDEDIMIEKIQSGEIEPNYYDIDDYKSMKRRGR